MIFIRYSVRLHLLGWSVRPENDVQQMTGPEGCSYRGYLWSYQLNALALADHMGSHYERFTGKICRCLNGVRCWL